MPNSKRILMPIDGSYYCQRAFQWALKHLIKPNDVVILVHVVEPPVLKSFSLRSGINIPVEEVCKKFRKRSQIAERLHSCYSNECVQANIKHEYYTVTSKSIGEGICQCSIDNNVDMIVIGNRCTSGISAIRRKLSGTISNFLINKSNVPVTIVPDSDD